MTLPSLDLICERSGQTLDEGPDRVVAADNYRNVLSNQFLFAVASRRRTILRTSPRNGVLTADCNETEPVWGSYQLSALSPNQ